MKNEKIIIVGASGSGKDFLLKGLIKKGEKYSPKITSRPIRTNEKQGVDYNYISNKDFEDLIKENKMKVYQKFLIEKATWYYGISKELFKNNNLFIMTPDEIKQISPKERKGCFVVYLDIDEETRRKRLMRRDEDNQTSEWKDSINRRIDSDRKDFQGFRDYDMRITDPEFDVDLVWNFAF